MCMCVCAGGIVRGEGKEGEREEGKKKGRREGRKEEGSPVVMWDSPLYSLIIINE